LIVWLTAALRPTGPYPILTLYGEQGSAKSTLARLIRLLVDPQDSPLLAQPRNTSELMATAVNGWLLAYDNLSAVPEWLSDCLCRLADGGGFVSRPRLSGDERSVINAQRPAVINGIGDFVRRGDLSDRCVFLHLPPIAPTARRTQAEHWASFQKWRPRIKSYLTKGWSRATSLTQFIEISALPDSRAGDGSPAREALPSSFGFRISDFVLLCGRRPRCARFFHGSRQVVAHVLQRGRAQGKVWRRQGRPGQPASEPAASFDV
jgi:hypothetical protein